MRLVLYRAGLSLLVTWSTLRIVLYGLVDRRPLIGFEAADLQRSMFYHYGLRGHLDYGFIEQIARDGFKPPLWYGGVPLLFSWRDTMSSLDFLWVNALALLLACWAVWLLGRKVGGERVAGLSVLCLCALPGLAGASTLIGVEMTQVAFFAWLILFLVDLHGDSPRPRVYLLFGLLLGLGMLAKWNLVVYLAAPIIWIVWSLGSRRRHSWQPLLRFGAGLLLAILIFLAWLVPFADVAAITQGALAEATYPSIWSRESLLFYPRMLLSRTLGIAAAPAAVLSLFGGFLYWRKGAEVDRNVPVFLLSVLALVSSLMLLSLFPHKELRYLQPLVPALAVLIAWGLSALPRSAGRAGRVAVVAAISWMLSSTLVVPWTQRAETDPVATVPFEALHFAPSTDDYGLEYTVLDASLSEPGFATVTYSLGGDLALPVGASLQWELYGRNEVPVVSRYNHETVTQDSCRYDLVRSSHFLTNRVLSDQEVDTITALGFVLRSQSSPRIESFGVMQLWRRVGRWR